MAHILVKNSLSNYKAVLVDINFPVIVTTDSKGEPQWVLETATTYPSASGTKVRPAYAHKATAFNNLDDAVADAISELAKQIDWLPLVEDGDPPYISDIKPLGEEVSIASNIHIDIKDDVPSAGIDLSDVKVTITTGNTEFDITNECIMDGDPFFYNIHWEPPSRVTRTYKQE
jgi:hypothetical protein